MPEPQNFWTTLPGILTGAATLITAAVAGYSALKQPSAAPPDASATAPPPFTAATAPTPPADTTPTPTPGSPIDAARYAKLYGPATSQEEDGADGGRLRRFQNATVYWHPRTGDFAVQGAILKKYIAIGETAYGYPTTTETPTPDGVGRFVHFLFTYPNGFPEERSIYWRPELGANAIRGMIRVEWARTGWEQGPLGYPVGDEYLAGAVARQDFQKGRIDWTPADGARTTLNAPNG